MVLKLINNKQTIKEYEEELNKLFLKKFDELKSITFINNEKNNRSFTFRFNLKSNIWFNIQEEDNSIKYYFGDLNSPTKYLNLKSQGNYINPQISISINLDDVKLGNSRFAHDLESNEKYLLLETVSSDKDLSYLKFAGLKNIKIKGTERRYFKLELKKTIEYLEAFIKDIKFYPITQPLNIKSYEKDALKEDLIKIQKNIPVFKKNINKSSIGDLVENKEDYILDNDELNESVKSDNMKKCRICHKYFNDKYFRKSSNPGQYLSVCTNCEEKIFVIQDLKIILNYVEPEESFDKEFLVKQHNNGNLRDILLNLEIHNLIKTKDDSYYLESLDVLNDFLDDV